LQWLNNDYKIIIDLFKIKNDQIIRSDNGSNNKHDIKLIAEHIFNTYINRQFVYPLLRSYSNRNKVPWYDLRKSKRLLKYEFLREIEHTILQSQV
jgi:hypothetical protein